MLKLEILWLVYVLRNQKSLPGVTKDLSLTFNSFPHTGWCNTLVAGPSSGAKGYMFFSVTMDLTEEGEGL